jgi:hypothetical protein
MPPKIQRFLINLSGIGLSVVALTVLALLLWGPRATYAQGSALGAPAEAVAISPAEVAPLAPPPATQVQLSYRQALQIVDKVRQTCVLPQSSLSDHVLLQVAVQKLGEAVARVEAIDAVKGAEKAKEEKR